MTTVPDLYFWFSFVLACFLCACLVTWEIRKWGDRYPNLHWNLLGKSIIGLIAGCVIGSLYSYWMWNVIYLAFDILIVVVGIVTVVTWVVVMNPSKT